MGNTQLHISIIKLLPQVVTGRLTGRKGGVPLSRGKVSTQHMVSCCSEIHQVDILKPSKLPNTIQTNNLDLPLVTNGVIHFIVLYSCTPGHLVPTWMTIFYSRHWGATCTLRQEPLIHCGLLVAHPRDVYVWISHACTHAHTHAWHTPTHAHTHTHARIHAHAHMRTRARTHARTHTHTHTLSLWMLCVLEHWNMMCIMMGWYHLLLTLTSSPLQVVSVGILEIFHAINGLRSFNSSNSSGTDKLIVYTVSVYTSY